ncbi:hypothetical protein CIB93_18405 [Streptomyces sp. WZ.A104]|uniref:hypothetical protein n=1 Tax=Streptomyces sp. WZ.A104 TaxID=2023771 RepID=UPI000BBB715C|nr:hypothetical protein [Streptomyces sp. WZ.A104]PCG84653.1 hypothetical protein CIB93_18405 [Streptomyces sp. WZ.A104]
MGSGITDAEGREVRATVIPVPPGGYPRVAVRLSYRAGGAVEPSAPAGELAWSCTPEAARELAASLVRAAEEAENAPGEQPVTVEAGALRRGDVRDGDRAMTVENVRTDGSTVHVTWRSGAGRTWTQAYGADVAITLKRRLPEGR